MLNQELGWLRKKKTQIIKSINEGGDTISKLKKKLKRTNGNIINNCMLINYII